MTVNRGAPRRRDIWDDIDALSRQVNLRLDEHKKMMKVPTLPKYHHQHFPDDAVDGQTVRDVNNPETFWVFQEGHINPKNDLEWWQIPADQRPNLDYGVMQMFVAPTPPGYLSTAGVDGFGNLVTSAIGPAEPFEYYTLGGTSFAPPFTTGLVTVPTWGGPLNVYPLMGVLDKGTYIINAHAHISAVNGTDTEEVFPDGPYRWYLNMAIMAEDTGLIAGQNFPLIRNVEYTTGNFSTTKIMCVDEDKAPAFVVLEAAHTFGGTLSFEWTLTGISVHSLSLET